MNLPLVCVLKLQAPLTAATLLELGYCTVRAWILHGARALSAVEWRLCCIMFSKRGQALLLQAWPTC